MGKKVQQSLNARLKEMVKPKPQNVNISESSVAVPTDQQSRYSQTIQTHTNTVVAPSTTSTSSAYVDADGFDKLSLTFTSSANATAVNKVYINVEWSHDGVVNHGMDIYGAKLDSGVARAAGIVDVKARYFKVAVVSLEAAPITINAWSYLKA